MLLYLRLYDNRIRAETGLFNNMKENAENLFVTADLGLAAFLLTKGAQLVTAGKDRNRYRFVFSEPAACQKLAISYVNSEFSRFDSNLKNLKNLIS